MKLVEIWKTDLQKAYQLQNSFQADENGFINNAYGYTFDEFQTYITTCHHYAQGRNLPQGFVPSTVYVLIDDEEHYVGIFNLRHYLNDALKNGAGHIGYGIAPQERGKGYATLGLKMMISLAKTIILEDEIYMSVHKNNPASLQVQIKNGAYIHHEDEKEYFTRIKISA